MNARQNVALLASIDGIQGTEQKMLVFKKHVNIPLQEVFALLHSIG